MHPPVRERIREYAYLAGIALVALAVGVAALMFSRHSALAQPSEPAGVGGSASWAMEPAPPLAAGQPARLTFRLADQSGAPVPDVVPSHEHLVHAIVVNADLQSFQHIHPRALEEPGAFELDVSFPREGNFTVFTEAQRADGSTVVGRHEVLVGAERVPRLALEQDLSAKVFGLTRLRLHPPESLASGQPTQLLVSADDSRTGVPRVDLRPYLGAPAHVVVISEDGGSFAHLHGTIPSTAAPGHDHGHAATPAQFGPNVAFNYIFPSPGLYKIWVETADMNYRVMTADFVLFVP